MVDQEMMAKMSAKSRKKAIELIEKQIAVQKKLEAALTIQTMKDELKVSREYLSVVQGLTGALSKEVIQNIDLEAFMSMTNEQREEAIKLAKKQAKTEMALEFAFQSSAERALDAIDITERMYDVQTAGYEAQIADLEHLNDLENQQIAEKQRGLDLISKQEEKINEDYDKRIQVLDKVAQANDRLARQEQGRISLASQLASGDIAGAAGTVSAMQADQAMNSVEDTRRSLEEQRARSIAALTTTINGVTYTRQQLLDGIDVLEESIYNRNVQIEGINSKLYDWEVLRTNLAKERAKYELEIYIAQERQRLAAIKSAGFTTQQQVDDYNAQAAAFNELIGAATTPTVDSTGATVAPPVLTTAEAGNTVGTATLAADPVVTTPAQPDPKLTKFNKVKEKFDALKNTNDKPYKDRFEDLVDQARSKWDASYADGKISDANLNRALNILDNGIVSANELKEQDDNISFKVFKGGKIPKFGKGGDSGFLVPGAGGSDTIKALLTPGEFVIRRSMVDKYGIPMLNSINQGAMPKFNIPSSSGVNVENGSGSNSVMYNNSYSINVNVAGTDASPDDIANAVMKKIQLSSDMNIRGTRY